MTESPQRLRYHGEGDLDTWFPVSFYERTIASPDPIHRYRYEALDVQYSRMGADRGFVMNFPPVVGDWIILAVEPPEKSGSFRVVDRLWRPSFYGSTYWPVTESRPVLPHHLLLIVDRAREHEGPFAWEAELEEEDSE